MTTIQPILNYYNSDKAAPEGFRLDPIPNNFDALFKYAEIQSKPFPFVRADFYLENGKVTFGELTFTPAGGLDPQRLEETQIYFGSKIELPKIM